MVPGVSSTSLKGEKLTATGGVVIRLIYINDEDKMDSCETHVDLDAGCEMSSVPENAVVFAKAKTDYVNCRAMSQRRVYVNGSVTVSFTVLSEKKQEFLCPCDDGSIEVRKTAFKGKNLICQGEKSFDLSETVSLESDKPDVEKILCTDAYCTVESQKTVTGKMLIKGELICNVVYCADKDNMKVQKIRHTMPISQIVDLSGLTDKSSCTLKLSVGRLLVNVKADSSGKNRLLEIAAKVTAFVKCTEVKEFQGVVDCYSTEFDVKLQNETIGFSMPCSEIRENKTIRKSYEMPKGIKEILCISAEDTSTKLIFSEDRAKFSLSTLLCIVYVGEKGVPSYAEKSFEAEFEQMLTINRAVYSGEIDGFVKELSWNVTGKDSFDVTADIVLEGEICIDMHEKLCKEAVVDEASPKKKDDSAIVIYYPQSGENLWDIAKKYNTTVKLLKEENEGLKSEKAEGKMLIIPAI